MFSTQCCFFAVVPNAGAGSSSASAWLDRVQQIEDAFLGSLPVKESMKLHDVLPFQLLVFEPDVFDDIKG